MSKVRFGKIEKFILSELEKQTPPYSRKHLLQALKSRFPERSPDYIYLILHRALKSLESKNKLIVIDDTILDSFQ